MSEQRPKPYIGVSGVGHSNEQAAVIDIALREGILSSGHIMMIGVQASSKTQLQERENRRGSSWYPVGRALSLAAYNEDSGLTKTFVHCSFENDEDLLRGVPVVMSRAINYVRGLQLNQLDWMGIDYQPFFEKFKEDWPYQQTVLQANRDTINRHSPEEIAQRLGSLPIDYVLFDTSHGNGQAFDVEVIRPYVDAVYQSHPHIGVAVAGGLEASTMDSLFRPLVDEFPGLSCDAEGRLRSGLEGWTYLDFGKVAEYIRAWKECLPDQVSHF